MIRDYLSDRISLKATTIRKEIETSFVARMDQSQPPHTKHAWLAVAIRVEIIFPREVEFSARFCNFRKNGFGDFAYKFGADQVRWMRENNIKHKLIRGHGIHAFEFENEADAIHYKLRWSGE